MESDQPPEDKGTTGPSLVAPPPMSQQPSAAGSGTGSGSVEPASVYKITRGHSCVLCQQRKVRCDKNKPCSNCVKAQIECVVVPPQPPRRRKNKPNNERERDLFDRLRRYELLLAQHGVRVDEEPLALPTVDDLRQGLVGLQASASVSASSTSLPSALASAVKPEVTTDSAGKEAKWSSYNDYRSNDEAQDDSSDDDLDGSALHRSFDGMFGRHDGFPFIVGGAPRRITEEHPPGIQIFQLWHIYLTNVNPLLKITHTPTLQAQIIDAGANLARIPPALEALMFAVYFAAVGSMHESDVQSTFDAQRSHLLARYHRASEQALLNAGFMSSSDLVVLQAYVLYLYCIREHVDPRALFCLIGIAVRVAQRMGLHRDGAQFDLPPYEVELRRRLWWQLVLLDKRIAEMTGSTFTALSTSNADTQFPLNINDADLHEHAKVAPVVSSSGGPTEMLFCLARIEIGAAGKLGGGRGASSSASPPAHQPPAPPSASQHDSPGGPKAGSTTGSSSSAYKQQIPFLPNPKVPDIITHVANQNVPDDMDNFCARIEATYLRGCDPKIPLHLFTLLMIRQELSKLRVARFLPHARARAARGAGGDDDDEADAAFLDAVCMVEYDNAMQSSPSLHNLIWYTRMHFPLPAYMLLVPELLRPRRHTGPLAERAWAALGEQYERRRLAGSLHNPVNLSFGASLVKAWDAHEAAVARQQPGSAPLPTPRFIQYLRQQRQAGLLGGGAAGGGGWGWASEGPTWGNDHEPRPGTAQAQAQQAQVQVQMQVPMQPQQVSGAVFQPQSYQPTPQPYDFGSAPMMPNQMPAPVPQIPQMPMPQMQHAHPASNAAAMPPMLDVGAGVHHVPAELMEGMLDWTYFVPQPQQSNYGYGGVQQGDHGGRAGGEGGTGAPGTGYGSGFA